MGKKFSGEDAASVAPAVPPEIGGINVNFCKNPGCPNFGVPANLVKWAKRKASGLNTVPGAAYTLSGVGKLRPGLKCSLCGEIFSIKSNLAVAEEAYRFAGYLMPSDPVCCPESSCANHTVPLDTPASYYRFGATSSGAQRWRCRACGKTFAIGGKALKRQRHFLFLRGLLRKVGKLRFFLDQDSGMRAGCLAAFAQDIKTRRVDAFYVRTAKDMTIDRKRSLLTASRANFKAFHDANPSFSPAEVEIALMKAEIQRAVALGKWSDRWCRHPMPTMSEPQKALCWLTDMGDYDEDHQAHLFLMASVRGIDNFFQRVRRSLNPLERPIKTASKGGRTWYGYNPYNPAMVEKLLAVANCT